MSSKLKQYFPMIREKEEILTEIGSSKELSRQFNKWNESQQEEFLNICTGVRGVKLLYDAFFKEIMNPEYKPERVNDFLSRLLKQEVKMLKVLPADSTRLADESSLVIMDVVVELADGSIANIEVQKIGYLFPGQRSACYSADLLLRQYKRVRGEKGKDFSYRDIKSVYTIILFEKSTREFHEFPKNYIHNFHQVSDTGLKMELLQKYLFIPLDIYRKNQHNKNIKDKLDGWLRLFSTDEPEEIIRLIEAYPEFKEIYKEVYGICRNVDEVMRMFSEELRILDRNTVQYMVDEMQEMLDKQKSKLEEQRSALEEQEGKLEEQKSKLEEQRSVLEKQEGKLKEQGSVLEEQEGKLKEQKSKLEEQGSVLKEQEGTINTQKSTIAEQKDTISVQQKQLVEAIQSAVDIMKEMNLSEESIFKKLQEKFHMSKEQAEQYLYR